MKFWKLIYNSKIYNRKAAYKVTTTQKYNRKAAYKLTTTQKYNRKAAYKLTDNTVYNLLTTFLNLLPMI
jgi:hypothetical protein